MSRECIELDEETATSVAFGFSDSPDYDFVDRQYEGSGRWDKHYLAVIKRVSDGKLFGAVVSVPATEMQEFEFSSDGETTFCEVDTIPSVTYYVKEK